MDEKTGADHAFTALREALEALDDASMEPNRLTLALSRAAELNDLVRNDVSQLSPDQPLLFTEDEPRSMRELLNDLAVRYQLLSDRQSLADAESLLNSSMPGGDRAVVKLLDWKKRRGDNAKLLADFYRARELGTSTPAESKDEIPAIMTLEVSDGTADSFEPVDSPTTSETVKDPSGPLQVEMVDGIAVLSRQNERHDGD